MMPIMLNLAKVATLAGAACIIAQHYHAIGKATGFVNGLAAGKQDGRTTGYAEGLTVGYKDGYRRALMEQEKDTQIAHLRGQLIERFHSLRKVEGMDEAC